MEVFKPPKSSILYGIKNWSMWKQNFQIYLKASNKETASEDLSCIGDEGLDIYIFDDIKKTL